MSKDKFLAYGSDRHALEAVMRLHSVKRWHMIDTTRQQTLAEHSANVAMLMYLLMPVFPEGAITERNVLDALVHDIAESFTGDVPTHTKAHLFGLSDLEDSVIPAEFVTDVPGDVKLIIKLCDLADGIRFIRLHGVDVTARHAREGLEKQYQAKIGEMFEIFGGGVGAEVTKILTFYAYENS